MIRGLALATLIVALEAPAPAGPAAPRKDRPMTATTRRLLRTALFLGTAALMLLLAVAPVAAGSKFP